MTRVSDNFFKLTTDIGDGYILRRDGDIVTGISTQELLAGISGGNLPNTFPYTTYINPNTTSLGTPDGSLSNPFLTVNDAISAIDSSIISLPEYIIKLAPGTYSGSSVVPVLETTRNYHFVGESLDSTICSDWIIVGSTGTIVFEKCNVISTGSWDQTGYNLTFINCSVEITSLTNLIVPTTGLLRFIDTVGSFGGATISDANTYLERDGRSKWGLVMNIPFVGNEPKIRDACSIPQTPNEYWVNNNAYQTNTLGWSVEDGTVAHPYKLLGNCLDQLDILGIPFATVHLAPSNSAYVYDNANITTQLCIIGDGTVKNCRINQFTCESMILEVRNCYFLASEFSVRMLKAVNCVVDANITVDTRIEFIDCKIEDASGYIRVYTAITSALWYVDLYSNYYSNIIPVTLVNIEKTILGDSSGTVYDLDGYVIGPSSATDNAIAIYDNVTGKIIKDSLVTIDESGNIYTPGTIDGEIDGYQIGITYIPVNYSIPSSNILGEHIAEIDNRLGNLIVGGIALSAGTNSKNSGTVSFVNSNGLSWGMDTAGAITGSVSVTAGGAAISAGTNSRNSGTISFADSNGVSFGMNTAGLLTASVSVVAGGFAISAGSNSKNSGTISFASASNGISCGMDTAGSITWSTTQPTQTTIGFSAGTNSRNSGTIIFSNSNGVSFGMDTAGIITGSVAAPNLVVTYSAGTLTKSSGTLAFANSNGISFGMLTDANGASITASTTQQAQTTVGMSAGTNSKNSGTISFASASNNVFCGMDTAGLITWSVATVAQSTIGISAGTNSRNTGSVIFSNSNGISFGMDTNGVITGSVSGGGIKYGERVVFGPDIIGALVARSGYSIYTSILGAPVSIYNQVSYTKGIAISVGMINSGSFSATDNYLATVSYGLYSLEASSAIQVSSWSVTASGANLSTAGGYTYRAECFNQLRSVSSTAAMTQTTQTANLSAKYYQVFLPFSGTINTGIYYFVTQASIIQTIISNCFVLIPHINIGTAIQNVYNASVLDYNGSVTTNYTDGNMVIPLVYPTSSVLPLSIPIELSSYQPSNVPYAILY